MTSSRPLTLDQVFDILPDDEELMPLRLALVESAGVDPDRRWTASNEYRLLQTRVVEPERLRSTLPALAAEAGRRAERVHGHVVEAIARLGEGSHGAAAVALVRAGEVEEEAGRPLSARRFYQKAAEVGRRGRDRSGEGLALRRAARLARAAGSLDEAEALYHQALSIAEAEGDPESGIVAYQGIGNVMGDQERWEDAEVWYDRGLAGFAPGLPEHLLWQLQVNLSVVARQRGNLAGSRSWLERARETASRSGNGAAAPYLRNAEGLLLHAEGDLRAAEATFRTALMETADPAERATFLVNLADSLIEQGRLGEARAACRDLEEVATASRLNAFFPYVYRAIGRISTLEKDENGFVFFEQALALSSSPLPLPHEEALTQRDYARFEASLGRVEAAIARLDIAEAIYRRIGAEIPASRISAERAVLRQSTASSPDVTHESDE